MTVRGRCEIKIVKDTISPTLKDWEKKLESPELERIFTRTAWIFARRAVEILGEKRHVVSGTLWRSVHAAPPGDDHSGDFGAAGAGKSSGATLLQKYDNAVRRMARDMLVTEVGSWIVYAKKIEDLGDGGYIWQAFEEKFKDACRYLESELRKLLGI